MILINQLYLNLILITYLFNHKCLILEISLDLKFKRGKINKNINYKIVL